MMPEKKWGKLKDYTNTKYLYITGENATKVIYAQERQISHYNTYYSCNYIDYFNSYFISHHSSNCRIPKVTTIVGTIIPTIVLTLGNCMNVSA